MSLSITIQKESDHLVFNVAGEWSLNDIKGLINTIEVESKNHDYRCILVDMTEVDKAPSEIDRYELGKLAASTFKNIRLAVIYKEEYINKLFEDTSANRGVSTYVVSDREAALRWLLES